MWVTDGTRVLTLLEPKSPWQSQRQVTVASLLRKADQKQQKRWFSLIEAPMTDNPE